MYLLMIYFKFFVFFNITFAFWFSLHFVGEKHRHFGQWSKLLVSKILYIVKTIQLHRYELMRVW